MNEHTETNGSENYVRIAITKSAKGTYSHETTVSFRWQGWLDATEVEANVSLLNRTADAMAREEIREREERDRWVLESGASVELTETNRRGS